MTSKILSRKFWVWIATCIITLLSMIVTKTIMPEVISMFTIISCIYIGGNTGEAFINMKRETKGKE